MALKVKWSKHADQNFDQILNYLEAEWGERVLPVHLFAEPMNFWIY